MIFEENGGHRDEIYAMWQRNFHDPVPYADFYFDEVYGKNDILLNISEEEIKGMLHMNPYDMILKGDYVKAHYLVGVATDEAYRRQGVMRELLVDTFSRLRKQGELFTYLMPADEHYYLPFDFRFGMSQLEQEMEGFAQAAAPESEGRYHFMSGLPKDVLEASVIENTVKASTFAMHTEITPGYLRRLEKETQSDYAKMFSVYQGDCYAGRFVVGAENDYMVLSQIFCVDYDGRKDFLYHALNYCEKEYHYGKYQLILDESWNDVICAAGNYQGVRLLPMRKKPLIMFRLLNLEGMGNYLRFAGGPVKAKCNPSKCWFRVKDDFLKEQDGIYLWEMVEHSNQTRKAPEAKNCSGAMEQEDSFRSRIRKISEEEAMSLAVPGGMIAIGDLTELIFGEKEARPEAIFEDMTQEGRNMLQNLQPVRLNCIQEIV